MVLDGNAVRSVDRAAALLLALGESPGEAGVTELARRLGLHKSTASRLLATLQKRGLVEQDDETGKYRLGLVVIRLAEKAERTLDLRGIAWPEMERLARLTHETTGIGILEGDTLLTVAQVDGPNLIAVGDWTGRSTPLHCVASGKVLLSSLAEREVLRIVRRGLVSYTERTIVELEPLLEELARIRRRGYATAIGEYGPPRGYGTGPPAERPAAGIRDGLTAARATRKPLRCRAWTSTSRPSATSSRRSRSRSSRSC
jgi:DNA-binding IclR family transcriptional regulator